MTFTWDSSDLTTALSQVRSAIGDTQENKQMLSDEQIEFRLDQYDDAVGPTAIRCVQDVIAHLARDVDRSNVGMSASRSQQITHYKDLLKELKAESRGVAESYVGGLSNSAADSINSDSDYRQVGVGIGWGKNNG